MNIDVTKLILNKEITFHCNPFGGIAIDDIALTLNPKHDVQEWIAILQKNETTIIEFVGEKGRGKTTHLSMLHQYFFTTPIYYLDRINTHKSIKESPILFIDSVGNVPFVKRLKLWSKKNVTYIVTTHKSRKHEYKLCGRNYFSYVFHGITELELKEIIARRVSLSSNKSKDAIDLDSIILKKLIACYGDDFRAILNFLYDNFNLNAYGHTRG